MLNKFKVFLLSIYFYLPTVLAEEVLYCISDIGSGLRQLNDGTWQTTDIKQQRTTIKFTGGYKKVNFYGDEFPCYELEGDHIQCNDKHTVRLTYNPQNMRYAFTWLYSNDYLEDNDIESTNAQSFVMYGKCESF